MRAAYFKTPEEAEAFASGVYLAENLDRDPSLVVWGMNYNPDWGDTPYVVLVKDKADPSDEERSVEMRVYPVMPQWP